jgi:hypothetical protein
VASVARTLDEFEELLKLARPASMGEVLARVDFPESLKKGEKITGAVTIRNPFDSEAWLGCRVDALWTGAVYVAPPWEAPKIPPGGTHTFLFPRDFTLRNPHDAPDPVMPERDATLRVLGAAARPPEDVRTEERLVTVKLHVEWWEQAFLGLPVWIWLLVAGGAVAIGCAAYYLEQRRREMYMLLLRKL